MNIRLCRSWAPALVALLGLMIAATPPADAGRIKKQIELKEPQKEELNDLLAAANELHEACFSQDESKIEASIKGLLVQINSVDEAFSEAPDQKRHLMRMLDPARMQLQVSQNSSGTDRRKSLKEAFTQLVNIAQTYSLDKYQIFFCPRDRSVWLQKGWQAKNPIHPKSHPNCGKLVR